MVVILLSLQQFKVDVGFERFLAPEIFFHPEFVNPDFTTPISEVVDSVIQNCPVDMRRLLYKVIKVHYMILCILFCYIALSEHARFIIHHKLMYPILVMSCSDVANMPFANTLKINYHTLRTLFSLEGLLCSRTLLGVSDET